MHRLGTWDDTLDRRWTATPAWARASQIRSAIRGSVPRVAG